MMKSTMKYISAAALMLAMAACSNDENLDSAYTNDPDAVRINATVGEGIPITRSNPIGTVEAQATFNTDDQIAVQAGKQAAVTYQYNGTAWTPVPAGAYLIWGSNPMNFTAYYPANKNSASMEAFTLPTDQSTLENLAGADYMTCTANGVTKVAAVSLPLTRKTARVVIKT
ncbi:MAG: fimbrillin family protein, partial [Oscillospiraceae bacterium]